MFEWLVWIGWCYSTYYRGFFFTGSQKIEATANSTLISMDNTTVDYRPFCPGEPNNANKLCIASFKNGSQQCYHDINCDQYEWMSVCQSM